MVLTTARWWPMRAQTTVTLMVMVLGTPVTIVGTSPTMPRPTPMTICTETPVMLLGPSTLMSKLDLLYELYITCHITFKKT